MKFPPDPPSEDELREILPDPPTDEEFEQIQRNIEREKEEWDPHDLPESQTQLVRDLHAAGAPDYMIENVGKGLYHDYVSPHVAPKHLLVEHANKHGLREIAQRAIRGDYDP